MMEWFEALVLGVLQGLTEFLPVSSSGHIEIGKAVLGVAQMENLMFTLLVHSATVLSTIVVFRKELYEIFCELLRFERNESTVYISKILVSVIPVGFVGILWKTRIEGFFTSDLLLVGTMLLVTALFLGATRIVRTGEREISFGRAIIIGLAQAIAVLPGISRSGATISTGLLLGIKRDQVARFSFLMVLIPVLGAGIIDLMSHDWTVPETMNVIPMISGFLGAFISGWLACRWMIRLVNKSRLLYFAIYCLLIGTVAICFS